MDVTFNNVLEGTRQYFMGVPKPARGEGVGQPVWPAGAPPPEEGAPAQSGAPAPSSRPPSAAAAPPSTPGPHAAPPRPPSEPLEPEPHIIHKATVMREALQKRREQPEPEDDDDASGALSPPSHIIHKPPGRVLPSPAAAPAAPSPSPARPPSAAPPEPQPLDQPPYRPAPLRVQTPTSRATDHYGPSRHPDPNTASRPPESFTRYHYETNINESSRSSHGAAHSPQPSILPRHSPQQPYGRISSSVPMHTVGRIHDISTHTSQSHRYLPSSQPPPHNDRVPPIHHPTVAASTQRLAPLESRSAHTYPSTHQRREPTHYSRSTVHVPYDRQPPALPRKYDPQQAYPGYRPTTIVPQTLLNNRVETQNLVHYKHGTIDNLSAHYANRPPERLNGPTQHHDTARLPRTDYSPVPRPTSSKSHYHYPTPSTSTSRYSPNVSVPVTQNSTLQSRSAFRPTPVPKSAVEYTPPHHVQMPPVRPTMKPAFASQPSRMTVSVTSIVDQMNQTKHKRESPLDLSVKTVKNSADSSTTQDDVESTTAPLDSKTISLQPRPPSSGRPVATASMGFVSSHKVDFAPDFHSQYRERLSNRSYIQVATSAHPTARCNGSYESIRPAKDTYPVESRQPIYSDRSKYVHVPKNDFVPRIDLTRSVVEERHTENRIRDDRNFIIEERKRPSGPIVNNIPEKIFRQENWPSDSRLDRLSCSAKEQQELMSQPVYSYSSHKRLEAYQNEHKIRNIASSYRDSHPHVSRCPYPIEPPARVSTDYHSHYMDRNPSSSNHRHIIQKIPHRDSLPSQHHHHSSHIDHSGVPADKRVLSILRNSLETKQTALEPARSIRQIPDLIVIDDVDDPVIEITDENESVLETGKSKPRTISFSPGPASHIQMPKAIDSIPRDLELQRFDNLEPKSRSPENDVSARIRTKGELKVLPPSQENSLRQDSLSDCDKGKLQPKSQKQHLFNQIREDNLRLESVIKTEPESDLTLAELKPEPMNIEEIEKDAEVSIKIENCFELEPEISPELATEEDLDWASACDSFVEQLQSGNHKKKPRKRRIDTDNDSKVDERLNSSHSVTISEAPDVLQPLITIKQEPPDEENIINQSKSSAPVDVLTSKVEEFKENKNNVIKQSEKQPKRKTTSKAKNITKVDSKIDTVQNTPVSIKKEKEPIKTKIKEEAESTDDDEPLIKSKILKEKEENDRMKYQMLVDLSEKSAYVKLECFDVELNKSNKKSLEMPSKEKDLQCKGKLTKQISRTKGKSLSLENIKEKQKDKDFSSDSDSDDLIVATRLRVRKSLKTEDNKIEVTNSNKNSIKLSPLKKQESSSSCSTPVRKPGFGDGSDFHPGWEEELYRFKRSLRMPTRLIAIPRGGSGGPFSRASAGLFTRGSTSLPDLDPAPLSPAPSSAPSAATDDLYARRQDKLTLDSDLESNSSCSAPNRLQYDSEASTSTVLSTKIKKKGSSIVDVLIQKCGKKDDNKFKKCKEKIKEDSSPKVMPKSQNELLPTPSLGLVKNGSKGSLSAKKEKLMEDIFYLGAFRKETVSAFRNAFINNTDGLLGATEEFAPVVLKTRTRTESRVLKQRATIKDVFGDERPASAPPSSCREEEIEEEEKDKVDIKKEPEIKNKLKSKKALKEKIKRRSSSIRDGLRSTKSLKRNDAKGRLMRLKKRNNLMNSLASKRLKEFSTNKHKKDKSPSPEDKSKHKPQDEGSSAQQPPEGNKKRFKRLFARRKFSSGFDYIRKKKKIIRREEGVVKKLRRPAVKPSPESVHDIQKEIKSWFINKSIGETPLHRAARLGYTDCVAYCLEKMESDPSAKDNAGFTPLHVAAAKGHVRIGRLLLQYGANVSAAAQGGIRPLHEACENSHVEMIRLLLSYGADPALGTYAGQTPEALAEGAAARLLRLHLADVQGRDAEPWYIPVPDHSIDPEDIGCDPLASPPPAPPVSTTPTVEIQCTEAPLPPFYSLRAAPGQPPDGLWCLLPDVASLLQIKSKESLLKQIHCGSGSPKELLREIRTQEFLERAQCHQLLCAGEKVNVRASKVALIRVTDKLRQLLKVETVLVS